MSLGAMLALGCGVWLAAVPTAPSSPDAGACDAKPLSVANKAIPNKVRLGEPFTYEVVITHTPAERYELSTPAGLGAFELLEQTRRRDDPPNQAKTTFRLKMALFELGSHPLPTLRFQVATPTATRCFALAGVEVEGLSSLPTEAEKGAELSDIKPPEDVPVRSYRLLYALLGAALAAGAGYLLYRYFTRPKPPPTARPAMVLPLHVRTRQALDALKREDLPRQNRGRELYFRLSEILRGYLGERYGFEALECTSSELLSKVDALGARELPVAELRRFVLESDLVKFAKQEPSVESCEAALAFGYHLVDKTFARPDDVDAKRPLLS